jgi:hypothetical protein
LLNDAKIVINNVIVETSVNFHENLQQGNTAKQVPIITNTE